MLGLFLLSLLLLMVISVECYGTSFFICPVGFGHQSNVCLCLENLG